MASPAWSDEKTDVNHRESSRTTGATSQEDKPYNGGATPIDRRGSVKHADRAFDLVGDQRIELTDEDNKRIRRKTDRVILAILVWVYFLQILDKSVLGYGATFGLQKDTVSCSSRMTVECSSVLFELRAVNQNRHPRRIICPKFKPAWLLTRYLIQGLTGNEYSLVGSIAPIAQLAWQPFSSILIVKVPHRILMPALCLGWGIAQSAMAACHNFGSLMATRFFLGLFEAGCLPLFSIITSQWYRRAEQPIRIAAWYSTNGIVSRRLKLAYENKKY